MTPKSKKHSHKSIIHTITKYYVVNAKQKLGMRTTVIPSHPAAITSNDDDKMVPTTNRYGNLSLSRTDGRTHHYYLFIYFFACALLLWQSWMKRMLSFLIAIAFDERHFSLFFSHKNSIEYRSSTKYSFQKHFYCKVNNGVCFRGGVGVNHLLTRDKWRIVCVCKISSIPFSNPFESK